MADQMTNARERIDAAAALMIGLACAAERGASRPLTAREADEVLDALERATLAITALTAAQQRIEELKGAMRADDERLRAAERRVFGDVTFGCDAPEHLADAVDAREQRIRELEQALAEREQELDDVRRDRMGRS